MNWGGVWRIQSNFQSPFFPFFSPLLKPTTPFSVPIFKSFSVPMFYFDNASIGGRGRFGLDGHGSPLSGLGERG